MYFLILFVTQQFSKFVEYNSFEVDFSLKTNGLIASCATYVTVKLVEVVKKID